MTNTRARAVASCSRALPLARWTPGRTTLLRRRRRPAAAAAGAGAETYKPATAGRRRAGRRRVERRRVELACLQRVAVAKGTSRVDAVQQQIDGVKTVMQDNIGQMLSNIERSQTLESTTEGLAQTATQFNRAARSTRQALLVAKLQVKLALGGGCLLLLIIILASSGAFSGGGGDASPPPPPPTYG